MTTADQLDGNVDATRMSLLVGPRSFARPPRPVNTVVMPLFTTPENTTLPAAACPPVHCVTHTRDRRMPALFYTRDTALPAAARGVFPRFHNYRQMTENDPDVSNPSG
jgi:hypothetical protein